MTTGTRTLSRSPYAKPALAGPTAFWWAPSVLVANTSLASTARNEHQRSAPRRPLPRSPAQSANSAACMANERLNTMKKFITDRHTLRIEPGHPGAA
jgi:hypothetical protein